MENELEISGKTLSIYLYMLLVRRPVGIREIQRKLGFSTPSLVHYHLNKLVYAGLVQRKASKYIVKKRIKIGILKNFVAIGTRLIPRYFFYAVFLTTMLIAYVTIFRPEVLTTTYIFALIIAISSALFAWTETIILWQDLKNLVRYASN